MKISKEKFQNITIIIESREELDQLTGLVSFAPLLKILPVLKDLYDGLQPYDHNYIPSFNLVEELFRCKTT